jgi:hypothetical protein
MQTISEVKFKKRDQSSKMHLVRVNRVRPFALSPCGALPALWLTHQPLEMSISKIKPTLSAHTHSGGDNNTRKSILSILRCANKAPLSLSLSRRAPPKNKLDRSCGSEKTALFLENNILAALTCLFIVTSWANKLVSLAACAGAHRTYYIRRGGARVARRGALCSCEYEDQGTTFHRLVL